MPEIQKADLVYSMEVSEGRAFIAGVMDGLRYVQHLTFSRDCRLRPKNDFIFQEDRGFEGAIQEREGS